MGEDCVSCPEDCTTVSGALCGNSLCEVGDGEDCQSCPVDCAGKSKGKDQFCCGRDVGCDDARCTDEFYCRTPVRVLACCGDALCEGQETESSCSVDCADGGTTCEPTSSRERDKRGECTDGIDNDCDGLIDGEDPDCGGSCTPVTEGPFGDPTCSDGIDNDCDDLVDDADQDCQQTVGCGDGVCDPGEDCETCSEDCPGQLGGKKADRYCCGNGVQETPEGDGSICDGNF